MIRHRCFVCSKATYGWIAMDPGVDWSNRINEAVMRAGLARRACKQLRYILDGGMVAMEVIIATRRLSIIANKLTDNQPWKWYDKAPRGSLQWLIDSFMASCSWIRKEPWKWEHETMYDEKGWLQIDLKQEGPWPAKKAKLAHLVRTGWRWKLWEEAKRGDTHANTAMKETGFQEE